VPVIGPAAELQVVGRRSIVQNMRRIARLLCLWPCASLASCASTSISPAHELQLAESTVKVSARAERGTTQDQLYLTINEVDVATAPFDASVAPVVVFEVDHEGTILEARCGHRWRPGFHIGYRCTVRSTHGGPVELDF
jgi:hypothetical protein